MEMGSLATPPRGWFRDGVWLRRIIGDLRRIRYYETVLEVVSGSGEAVKTDEETMMKRHPTRRISRYRYRAAVVTNHAFYLINMPSGIIIPRKHYAGKNLVWCCVSMDAIRSIWTVDNHQKIFRKDEINHRLQGFFIRYVGEVSHQADRKCLKLLELVLWEESSLLLYHIKSAGFNFLIDRCLSLDINRSKSIADKYQLSSRRLYWQLHENIIRAKIEASDLECLNHKAVRDLSKLATLGRHDFVVKRLFFNSPSLLNCLEQILDSFPLLQAGSIRRKHQLRYVERALCLLHNMLFDSQTVRDRNRLLTLEPQGLQFLLSLLCKNYCANVVIADTTGAAVDDTIAVGGTVTKYLTQSDPKTPLHICTYMKFRLNDKLVSSATDESEHEKVGNILEIQVGILIELDNMISVAARLGNIKQQVISETLPSHFGRSLTSFSGLFLIHVVGNTILLIEKLGIVMKEKVDMAATISVSIFLHCKLLKLLTSGSFSVLEFLFDQCSEEMTAALFDDRFLQVLELPLPDSVYNGYHLHLMNSISRKRISEIQLLMDQMSQYAKHEIEENSVPIEYTHN